MTKGRTLNLWFMTIKDARKSQRILSAGAISYTASWVPVGLHWSEHTFGGASSPL